MARERILIVEDEPIVRLDIRKQLERLGYEVAGVASTGEGVTALIEVTKPDLVLMDILLKGQTDGIETALYIRDHWDVPVVYLTAHSDEDTLRRAKMSGSYGYVLKPFEEHELQSTIEAALYKHAMDRKLRENHQ